MIAAEPSSVSRQLNTIAIRGRFCGPLTIAPLTMVRAPLKSALAGTRAGVVGIECFATALTSGVFVRTGLTGPAEAGVLATLGGFALAVVFATGAVVFDNPFNAATDAGFVELAAIAPRTPNSISLSARAIPLIRTSSIKPTKLLFGLEVTGLCRPVWPMAKSGAHPLGRLWLIWAVPI